MSTVQSRCFFRMQKSVVANISSRCTLPSKSIWLLITTVKEISPEDKLQEAPKLVPWKYLYQYVSSYKIWQYICFNTTKVYHFPFSLIFYSVGHWTRHQDANFTFGEMWQKLGRTHQVYVYCSVFLCNLNIMFYIFPSSTLQYWELGLESGQDWNCCRSVLHAIRPLFITGEKWPSRVTIHSTCAFVRI